MSNTNNLTHHTLSDRMRGYERVSQLRLTKRLPIMVNVKIGLNANLQTDAIMVKVAMYLVDNIISCKFAFIGDGEISLILVDYDSINSESWCDNNVQLMISKIIFLATKELSIHVGLVDVTNIAANIFTMPKEEVTNYIIWKQNILIRSFVVEELLIHNTDVSSPGYYKGMRMSDMINILDRLSPTSMYDGYRGVINNSCFGYSYRKDNNVSTSMPHIKTHKFILDGIVYNKPNK